MKKQKHGISLMVLILTIIVMSILAGTVIISLNNAGVINRAQDTVGEYNLNQVDELANVAWAEAYLAGNTTKSALETYVMEYLNKAGVKLSQYNIEVTTKGVVVTMAQDMPEEEMPISWKYAWVYENNTWSAKYTEGQNVQGKVIAKLYESKDNNNDELIIEGTGKVDLNIFTNYDLESDDREIYERIDNIVIKDGITEVGGILYPDYLHITSDIYLAKTVSNINFNYNYNVVNVIIDENNEFLKVIDGIIYSKDGKRMIAAPNPPQYLSIPMGVVSIETWFGYDRGPHNIIIPETVEEITSIGAFGVTKANVIKIYSTNIKSIANNAFDTDSETQVYVLDEATKEKVLATKGYSDIIVTVVTKEQMDAL